MSRISDLYTEAARGNVSFGHCFPGVPLPVARSFPLLQLGCPRVAYPKFSGRQQPGVTVLSDKIVRTRAQWCGLIRTTSHDVSRFGLDRPLGRQAQSL